MKKSVSKIIKVGFLCLSVGIAFVTYQNCGGNSAGNSGSSVAAAQFSAFNGSWLLTGGICTDSQGNTSALEFSGLSEVYNISGLQITRTLSFFSGGCTETDSGIQLVAAGTLYNEVGGSMSCSSNNCTESFTTTAFGQSTTESAQCSGTPGDSQNVAYAVSGNTLSRTTTLNGYTCEIQYALLSAMPRNNHSGF